MVPQYSFSSRLGKGLGPLRNAVPSRHSYVLRVSLVTVRGDVRDLGLTPGRPTKWLEAAVHDQETAKSTSALGIEYVCLSSRNLP